MAPLRCVCPPAIFTQRMTICCVDLEALVMLCSKLQETYKVIEFRIVCLKCTVNCRGR